MLHLTTKVEDLHRLALAIKVQTADSIVVPKTNQTSNSGSNLARLTNFKAQQLTLEISSSKVAAGRIDRASLLLADEDATRILASYRKTSVWVEWKTFTQTVNYNQHGR